MDNKKEYYVYEYFIIETNEVFYVGKGKGRRAFTKYRNKFCEDMKKSHNWSVRFVKKEMYEKDAFNLEMLTIKKYKEETNYRLTNQTDGGEGTSGWKCPNWLRIVHGENSKKRWDDDKYKTRLTAFRNNKNEVFQSQAFKEKMSSVTKGVLNGNFEHHWSDEQKSNLSKKRIENGKSKGINNPRSQSIMCVETGVVYAFARQAKAYYGMKSDASISLALDNPVKTASYLHWVKITNENLLFWKDPNNKRDYLLHCATVTKSRTPILCIETNKVYQSKVELSKEIGLSVGKISKITSHDLKYNNKTYRFIEIKKSLI